MSSKKSPIDKDYQELNSEFAPDGVDFYSFRIVRSVHGVTFVHLI